MGRFEEVFFVAACRLPVVGLDWKFRWFRRQRRHFLVVIIVEDPVASSVFYLLIVMLVVVVVVSYVGVGTLVARVWMMVENHCRVYEEAVFMKVVQREMS